MKDNIYQTTLSGLKKLKEELQYREKELREKIANVLNEMRNQGDLKENDGYSMAIEDQQINEDRIIELKDKIKKAQVVKDRNKSIVGVGDTVVLKNEDKTIKYQITSEDEANPLEGRISYLSPIGQAVMGKKLKSEIVITTPKGSTTYILTGIE
jgi:transcription elongation factor GreA